MLKNSEWGVVIYLTESEYGRNGNEMEKNDTIITGGGTENAYVANALQSTTGNIYGVYGFRRGGYEYVAAYFGDSYDLTDRLFVY